MTTTELDTHSKLKNVIQETKDYDIFKKLPGNRKTNTHLINDLIRSYIDKPQLIVARPLLLNELSQVVDGQHRLEALMRTGKPVPYMVVKGLTVSDARLMNSLQRTWTLEDFARSYAETEGAGNPYQQLVKYMEEYNLPPRVLITYTTGSVGGSETSRKFRHGDYKPRDERVTQAWLDKLTEFAPYMKKWNEQAFAVAASKLFTLESYDHERMIRKLHDSDARLVHRSGVTDYLRDLETIYNANNPAGRYLRFV